MEPRSLAASRCFAWLRSALACLLLLSVAVTATAQTTESQTIAGQAAATPPRPGEAASALPSPVLPANVHRGDEVFLTLKTPAGKRVHGNVVAFNTDSLVIEGKTRIFPHYVPHTFAYADIDSIAAVPLAAAHRSHDERYIAPLVIYGTIAIALVVTLFVILLVKRPPSALAP